MIEQDARAIVGKLSEAQKRATLDDAARAISRGDHLEKTDV